jgi:hypothetical protein
MEKTEHVTCLPTLKKKQKKTPTKKNLKIFLQYHVLRYPIHQS